MDNVNGVIVGGDYVSWQVFYSGRSQTGKNYADNEKQARGYAEVVIQRLKSEFKGFPCYLFQDDSRWDIRIS